MQHRAGLINEVDRTLGFVRTKANLLVSDLGISVAKLFLDILRAFRPQASLGGLGGRPVSTNTPTFVLGPEQPAARGDVAPLGRPTYFYGRLRIIRLASLRPLSLQRKHGALRVDAV